MPTGYTETLCKQEQTFKEFALGCARAFGACIDLRDSSSKDIPEEFTINKHYIETHDEYCKERDRLLDMSPAEQIHYGETARKDDANIYNKLLDEKEEANQRLLEMTFKVMEWNPPTENHEQLKEFMLDQIKVSTEDTDYYYEQLDKIKNTGPLEYYNKHLKNLERLIESYLKDHGKEVERTTRNNEWVKQLRDSLA